MQIDDSNIYSDVSCIEHVVEMPSWVVLSSLGRGSKGEVFLVRDREGNRHALKKMYSKEELEKELPSDALPYLFDKEGVPHSARHEWKASQNLHHPAFVKVFQFYPGKETSLLMEWIEGQTLDEVPFSSMDARTVVNLLLEGIDGLMYAFNEGWINHDLYSSNVMIDQFNHLKFIDLESFDKLSHEDREAALQDFRTRMPSFLDGFDKLGGEESDMTLGEYRDQMIFFFESMIDKGNFSQEQKESLSVIFKRSDDAVWTGPLTSNAGPVYISYLEKIRDQITSLL